MPRDDGVSWARLGRVEKTFLVMAALLAVLFFFGISATLQFWIAAAVFFLGIAVVVRLARFALRKAIWRLRNRLMVAYLFIAVVPIVLILALLAGTAYLVVGQMAVYLVYTELSNRVRQLAFPTDAMVRAPARDPQQALN